MGKIATKSTQVLLGLLGIIITVFPCEAYFNLPPLPTADKYGDVVMDQCATAQGQKAVVFSHWSHRTRFSCRVCHFELDFAFVAGQSDINEEDMLDGDFCGACHDGSQAFGVTKQNCEKCHTGNDIDRSKQFAQLQDKLWKLPQGQYGNNINWTLAQQQGLIDPKYSMFRPQEKPLAFAKALVLDAEWSWVSPAVFNHDTHTPWLDCANCHPSIFNIKKKTTKHFRMVYILEKKFCGVCHFAVSLPIDDCSACHPDMRKH
ncbi:MAG: c(7)-type cytochrome triheme domain-containing protein [Thermodesulfobacteriota bacterium]|nr:c(7)-type cytochrome triheme domain-containing protein [Thermodesulfobacteriota bacterium]